MINLHEIKKEQKLHWSVWTPQMTSYYEDEPPEQWADWICVEAPTKREALIEAVKQFRKNGSEWIQYQRDDNANPFSGLQVESTICEHGNCNCEIDECIESREFDICPICYKETDLEIPE